MLFRFLCLALCVAAASACRREAIRVYVAPKDPIVAQPDSSPSARSRPRLTWHLPTGWQQTDPGQVSVANFVVKSATGDASINITPMPNLAGRESMVVNMWREQLHQPPLREEEITAAMTPVQIGSESGHLFELTNEQRQIVTAMLHRADSSWFFKLAGDTATVAAKKPEFLAFLKTISFPESSDEAADEDSSATTSFHWVVPAEWKKAAPGKMQAAKFLVTGADDKKSEVTVSIFPNDTGGTLLNVNRWRKQIGLAPIDDAELKQAVTALDPNTPDAVLADLTNEERRLLGAIVPRGGQWFFYKMLGDASVVAQQRDAFIEFAKSSP